MPSEYKDHSLIEKHFLPRMTNVVRCLSQNRQCGHGYWHFLDRLPQKYYWSVRVGGVGAGVALGGVGGVVSELGGTVVWGVVPVVVSFVNACDLPDPVSPLPGVPCPMAGGVSLDGLSDLVPRVSSFRWQPAVTKRHVTMIANIFIIIILRFQYASRVVPDNSSPVQFNETISLYLFGAFGYEIGRAHV